MSEELHTPTPPSPPSFNEHDVIRRYFEEQSRRGVMLDVGAMHGSSFEPFVDLGWEIFAFEPDPAKKKTLNSLKSDRVHLADYALSNEVDYDAPFFVSPESEGVSTLNPFLDSHRETTTVDIKTLEQVVRDNRIQKVDYLKIDTEGFDLKVLQGFPWRRAGFEWLGRSRWPEVILCEFDNEKSENQGYDHNELGSFLLERNYEVYLSEWSPIQEYGLPHHWVTIRPFSCGPLPRGAWGNFIALSPKGDPDTLRRLILEGVLMDRDKVQESLNNRDRVLPGLRAGVEKKDRTIDRLNTDISAKKESLARQQDSLERQREALAERNTVMEKRLETIRTQKLEIEKRDSAISRLKENLAKKEKGLERQRIALENRNAGLGNQRLEIQRLKTAIEERDRVIADLKTALHRKDEGLERLREALTERNAGMEKRLEDIHQLKEALQRSIDDGNRWKAALAAKDEGLSRMRDALEDRNDTIGSLRQALRQRNDTITHLKRRTQPAGKPSRPTLNGPDQQ